MKKITEGLPEGYFVLEADNKDVIGYIPEAREKAAKKYASASATINACWENEDLWWIPGNFLYINISVTPYDASLLSASLCRFDIDKKVFLGDYFLINFKPPIGARSCEEPKISDFVKGVTFAPHSVQEIKEFPYDELHPELRELAETAYKICFTRPFGGERIWIGTDIYSAKEASEVPKTDKTKRVDRLVPGV